MRHITEFVSPALLAIPVSFACTSADTQADDEPSRDSTTGTTAVSPSDDESVPEPMTTGETDGGAQAPIAGNFPCEVEALLIENCQSCHADPPRFGAPMPLVELSDLDAPLPSDPSRTVAEAMHDRVSDHARPMPPTGLLPEHERSLLVHWLAEGRHPGEDESCDLPEPDDGPAVGPEGLPCEPTHTFLAHGFDTDAPFHVPEVDDLYTCFVFPAPFAAEEQAIAWTPIIDDDRVLHHYIVYSTQMQLQPGAVGPCSMPDDANYLVGWAPGRGNFELPANVGLELPNPGGSIILEIHYNNVARHADALDRSGVAFCTVDEPRTHTAGFLHLGTTNLDIPPQVQDHEEVGMCPSFATNQLGGNVEVISTFPHMHELGRSFRTEILRNGDEGSVEILVDVPHFSFDYQVGYDFEPFLELRPGDALRTTCTYDNPRPVGVGYGPGTMDEMCFNRVLVYPVDQVPWRTCIY